MLKQLSKTEDGKIIRCDLCNRIAVEEKTMISSTKVFKTIEEVRKEIYGNSESPILDLLESGLSDLVDKVTVDERCPEHSEEDVENFSSVTNNERLNV